MQELDLGATCDDLELDRILRRSFSLRRRSSALALAPAAMLVTRERERLVLLSALDLRVDVLALGGRARNLLVLLLVDGHPLSGVVGAAALAAVGVLRRVAVGRIVGGVVGGVVAALGAAVGLAGLGCRMGVERGDSLLRRVALAADGGGGERARGRGRRGGRGRPAPFAPSRGASRLGRASRVGRSPICEKRLLRRLDAGAARSRALNIASSDGGGWRL
mmetsp:Transcript_11796/g.22974  ORF Transcript_11796/g.22974 Transcript_11796/m.22974 type:complete len:220 (-) Transcript_11796:642-1301(-)